MNITISIRFSVMTPACPVQGTYAVTQARCLPTRIELRDSLETVTQLPGGRRLFQEYTDRIVVLRRAEMERGIEYLADGIFVQVGRHHQLEPGFKIGNNHTFPG